MSDGQAQRAFDVRPIDPPAGYYRVTSNGRVHLVRRAQRVAHQGESWVSAEFWCATFSAPGKGAFLKTPTSRRTLCATCVLRHQRSQAAGGRAV